MEPVEKIYYLYHNHQKEGPLSLYELADQLNHLGTNPETRVLCTGGSQWQKYEDMAELQNMCAARRSLSETLQNAAAKRFTESVYQEQKRRSGMGSLAHYRFSILTPETNEPALLPRPRTSSRVETTQWLIGCVVVGGILAWGVFVLSQ